MPIKLQESPRTLVLNCSHCEKNTTHSLNGIYSKSLLCKKDDVALVYRCRGCNKDQFIKDIIFHKRRNMLPAAIN